MANQAQDHPTLLEDTDHKQVGRLYILFGFGFMILGGLAGFLMRAQLARPGSGQPAAEYARSFSLHVTVLAVLALPAIWAGLASHLVPLQIGANRVAFPRLLATSLWVHVAGGGLMLASYAMEGLGVLGPSLPAAVNLSGEASTADQLWVTGAGVVALASLAVALTLAATVVTLRAPAVRLSNLPLFSWAVLATAVVSIVSIPVHLAGLTILYIDRHFAGELFRAAGSDDVWRHSIWLLGRPEIFLLTVPGLGVAAAVVAGHARRPLLGEDGIRGAIAAAAVFSLAVWAAGSAAAVSLAAPTFSPVTVFAALIPLTMIPAWIGTLVLGRPRLHPSLGFVAGAAAVAGLAALNGVASLVVDGEGGAWSTGYLHSGFFVPPLLLACAGFWHWAPKLWGRTFSAGAGWLAALLLTGGSVVQSGASFIAGYQGAANRTAEAGSEALNRLAAGGAALTLLGLALVVIEIARATLSGPERGLANDPWGETAGLEWTVASPPERRNFDSPPGAEPVEVPAEANDAAADDGDAVAAEPEPVGAPS